MPDNIRWCNAPHKWGMQATAVSPDLLETLKRGASKMQFGQRSVRYRYTRNGQKID